MLSLCLCKVGAKLALCLRKVSPMLSLCFRKVGTMLTQGCREVNYNQWGFNKIELPTDKMKKKKTKNFYHDSILHVS